MSRRCRSVECRSEHVSDEHAFKNPISKWYRKRKLSKDDEAQLLAPDYDINHEHSQQGLRQCHPNDACQVNVSGTEAPQVPPSKPAPELRPLASAVTEDLSTRTRRLPPTPGNNALPATPPRSCQGLAPRSCQPPGRPLCPADRARLAFPGCREKLARPNTGEHPRPTQSLDALLGQLCSGNCSLAMKFEDTQDSTAALQPAGDRHVKEAPHTLFPRSHLPSSFPTSIEVLMTVNHTCSSHKSSSERSLQGNASTLSVVHTKQTQQDIISIPKSRFIVVSALLSFVMVACFSITIYSFAVPPEYSRSGSLHQSSLADNTTTTTTQNRAMSLTVRRTASWSTNSQAPPPMLRQESRTGSKSGLLDRRQTRAS